MTSPEKPQFMRWFQERFWANWQVRALTYLQRAFYRALLLEAFYCSTAPDLPNDDALLWRLADAESLELWQANKGPVLALFQVVAEGERQVLVDSTLREEWGRLEHWRDKSRAGGKASAASRSKKNQPDSQQPLNGGSMVVQPNANGGSTVVQPNVNQAQQAQPDGSSNKSRVEKRRKEKEKTSSSSVGLVNGKATTTTAKAPVEITKKLVAWGFDVEAVDKLWAACRAKKKDCTEAEVLRFCDLKWNQRRQGGESVRNWVGFLLCAVPKCFEEVEGRMAG